MAKGVLVVGQSGGPTVAINSTLVGIIHEALEHPQISAVYGAVNGIEGVLSEDFIDLGRESPQTLEGLRHTPAAALGTVRHKVKEEEYDRILEVFRAHNVRYFLYVGGNDSMDTAHQLHLLADGVGYELHVVGVPKTVDNDLVGTDHCPGYGSAARFVAIALRDTGRDTEAMGRSSPVKIVEIMGRNAGWLTAASALARDEEGDSPHLIYLPERRLPKEKLIADVKCEVDRRGYVVIAMSEGVEDENGLPLGEALVRSEVDAFGHRMKGGCSDGAEMLIREELGLKVRIDKPNYLQRSMMIAASSVDLDEAYRVGRAAVQAVVSGQSDVMVTLVRQPGPVYYCDTGLAPLAEIANKERRLPDEYIAPSGHDVTSAFVEWARPLIGDPLPPYARLARIPVAPRTKTK